jgi:hypothetical protein
LKNCLVIARIVELQGWGRGWCKKVLLNLRLKTIKFQLLILN